MSEKEPQIIIPLRDYFQLSLYCLVNELELCKEDEVEETRMMLEDAKELIFRLQAENEVMLTKLARPLKITMCDL